MKSVGAASLWLTEILIATTVAPGCGGLTSDDATQSGLAGTGGLNAGSGGTGSAGGAGNSSGSSEHYTDAGPRGGVIGSNDAGSSQDAGICSADAVSRGLLVSANTIDMVDCAIPVNLTVPHYYTLNVAVNCTVLPDSGLSSESWTIDYTTDPARLVFGAALCAQVKALGQAPVYIFWIHTTIV